MEGRNRPQIDLILMDVLMPELDGVEAVARSRSDPIFAIFPFIMVTAKNTTSLTSSRLCGGSK